MEHINLETFAGGAFTVQMNRAMEPIATLNSEENLAAICSSCNATKKVERE